MYGTTALNIHQRLFLGLIIIVAVSMMFPHTAHAAGSAMPWEALLS